MKKNEQIIILSTISLLIFIIFIKIFFIFQEKPKENLPISDYPAEKTYTEEKKKANSNQVLIEINGIKYKTNYIDGMSVYDSMNQLKNEREINFVEKNYIGMGKFISEINSIKGNGIKNWIYYVNGVEAQVGVSNYKIKNGDVISWRYE
ncbi:DUF4430 domain-containing protein [Candidatus Nomurabacteria bacterium]|nr:DUF4430 domain-containing protein [Candidatus Nomurabacteria bacterium]